MAIILERSVFYHIGRTGGHWVNAALWRGNLIKKRIYPLHVAPAQLLHDEPCVSDLFAFCFVRHPLKWAASLWQHEMEYGWSPSDFSRAAASDVFSVFLNRLTDAFPGGACVHAMKPYTDYCNFVGKAESIGGDLKMALSKAGEDCPSEIFDSPPINVSDASLIKQACRAPARILKRFMDTNKDFCEIYNYRGIPRTLVGPSSESPWPKIKTKRNTSNRGAPAPIPTTLSSRTRFRYDLDNGEVIAAQSPDLRLQWSLINLLSRLKWPGHCAIVSEYDPYLCYLLPFGRRTSTTFVCSSNDHIPSRLMSQLAFAPETKNFEEFHKSSDSSYDTVILSDSADINATLVDELFSIARILKDGGVLAIVSPTLNVEAPLETIIDRTLGIRRSRKIVYRSHAYMKIMLRNLGFGRMEVVDEFLDVPATKELRDHVDALAESLGEDSYRLLGKSVLIAQRDRLLDHKLLDANSLSLKRTITDLADAPYDSLSPAIEARLLALESELRAERRRREYAEQGLADREQDLISARRDVHNLNSDANYSREQLIRARQAQGNAEDDLRHLRNVINGLKIKLPGDYRDVGVGEADTSSS